MSRSDSSLRAALKRHHLCGWSSRQCRCDPLAHLVAQRTYRIVGAVHISACHRQIAVTQEITHEEGIGARLPGVGADRVAKIMQPNTGEAGGRPDLIPCRFQPGARKRAFGVHR
jgi:hypothetical protein